MDERLNGSVAFLDLRSPSWGLPLALILHLPWPRLQMLSRRAPAPRLRSHSRTMCAGVGPSARSPGSWLGVTNAQLGSGFTPISDGGRCAMEVFQVATTWPPWSNGSGPSDERVFPRGPWPAWAPEVRSWSCRNLLKSTSMHRVGGKRRHVWSHVWPKLERRGHAVQMLRSRLLTCLVCWLVGFVFSLSKCAYHVVLFQQRVLPRWSKCHSSSDATSLLGLGLGPDWLVGSIPRVRR